MPDAPAFTPSPVRFRVAVPEGDGWTVQHPGGDITLPTVYAVDGLGVVWKGTQALPGWRVVPGAVALLSTGLRDAAGVEVFEGDVMAWNESCNQIGPTVVGTVERSRFAEWVTDNGRPLKAVVHRYGGHVTGNVYEGVREPA